MAYSPNLTDLEFILRMVVRMKARDQTINLMQVNKEARKSVERTSS